MLPPALTQLILLVARVFTSLGSKIYAYTSSARPTPLSRRDHGYHLPNLGDPDGTLPLAWYSGTTKADLHTFLSQDLDILVVCLPLTPQTSGLIGEEEFRILSRRSPHPQNPSSYPSSQQNPRNGTQKPGAFVINISRGAILSTTSLTSFLKSGALSGAALDVTDPEPLPVDSELWDMENVVLTPHMSGLTVRYLERALGGLLVENLGRRESGQGLWNLVDRRRGY
jgi:phosphoglycerate dehydrogenase-like enzyme